MTVFYVEKIKIISSYLAVRNIQCFKLKFLGFRKMMRHQGCLDLPGESQLSSIIFLLQTLFEQPLVLDRYGHKIGNGFEEVQFLFVPLFHRSEEHTSELQSRENL